MTQASTFDVQLSPVCPWCGQVGNQVWCNEVTVEKSRVSRSCRSRSTQQNTIADVFSKDLGCVAPFLVMAVTYSCFGYVTVTYSIFGMLVVVWDTKLLHNNS